MPIKKYFQGHGLDVMQSMLTARKGDKKAAQREFYATANARGMKPKGKK